MKTNFAKQFVVASLLLLAAGCKEDAVFYSNLLRSDVYVQQYSDSKYDFLWVLDNSASMVNRRQFVRDNLQTFLNTLNSRKAVDYQMAVTTTDMMSFAGDLVTAPGGLRVIKSSTSSNVVADFASIVNAVVDSPTSFWEQGLESAYQAVKLHGSEFSRDGVPLIVIFVTDEDDYSCASHCYGVEPENNPDTVLFPASRYSDYFSAYKISQKTSTFVFPIVGVSTGACTVASYGDRYKTTQEVVGGLGKTASICNDDMQASYNGIASVIGDRGMVFKLSQVGTAAGLRVFIDDQLIPGTPDNYKFDAASNSIIFSGIIPKNGSVIQVSYSQNTAQ
jgi:hypothetical protein